MKKQKKEIKKKKSSQVITWLLLCSIMILLVVGIGGFTRLSRAGLSIPEWKPVSGILPPLNEQDWLQAKLKYEITPEYKILNYGIDMKKFHTIYLIEYLHRLIARLAGLFFILPFLYFVIRKRITGDALVRLSIVLLFGVLQAFVGWYMVKSGLISEPRVSHYRLALHLLLALFIFALLLYQFFDYQISLKYIKLKTDSYTIYYVLASLILIAVQITFGALVSGLDAGHIHNTFPLMDGYFIPKDLCALQPVWLNLFENNITVQFTHRILAFLVLLLTVILTIKNCCIKPVCIILLFVTIQIVLGVITLLFHIPIAIAVLHQVFSFILFGSYLYFLCLLRKNFTYN